MHQQIKRLLMWPAAWMVGWISQRLYMSILLSVEGIDFELEEEEEEESDDEDEDEPVMRPERVEKPGEWVAARAPIDADIAYRLAIDMGYGDLTAQSYSENLETFLFDHPELGFWYAP